MSKFELYNIVLKDIVTETRVLEFDLDNAFFKKIDSPEIQTGNVKAKVSVQKKTATYELKFEIDGSVNIPCDRCLDNMEQPIHYKEKLLRIFVQLLRYKETLLCYKVKLLRYKETLLRCKGKLLQIFVQLLCCKVKLLRY